MQAVKWTTLQVFLTLPAVRLIPDRSESTRRQSRKPPFGGAVWATSAHRYFVAAPDKDLHRLLRPRSFRRPFGRFQSAAAIQVTVLLKRRISASGRKLPSDSKIAQSHLSCKLKVCYRPEAGLRECHRAAIRLLYSKTSRTGYASNSRTRPAKIPSDGSSMTGTGQDGTRNKVQEMIPP